MRKILPLLFHLASLQFQRSSGEVYKSISDESIQNVTAALESVVQLVEKENEFDTKRLAHLLKEFGPALKALAPETQMIVILIESGIVTSVDTSLLREKLKKINEKLDKIENVIRVSLQPYYGTQLISGSQLYWNIRDKIRELERRFKLYLAFPRPYTSCQFREGCMTYNPVESLHTIYAKAVAPVFLPRLFPSLIAASGQDKRQLNIWAKLVSSDTLVSAYLSLMCLGMDLVYNGSHHPTSPALRADIASRQLVAISDALVGYQRDLQARLDVETIPDLTVEPAPRGNNNTMTPSAAIAFAIGFAPMSLLSFLG